MVQPFGPQDDRFGNYEAERRRDEFSLIRGGPFYRAQEVTRLIRPNEWNLPRRLVFALAVAWLPLLLLTLLFNPQALRSLLTSYVVNARLLIAVPVLLAGQLLMEMTFRTVVGHIREAGIVSREASDQVQKFLSSLRRLRDSPVPELVILALIYIREIALAKALIANNQAWAVTGSAHLTPAGWYYSLVSQVLYQFLLGVAVWKWVLWSFLLFRLSKLDLELVPTHPDLRGGLGFLGLSTLGNSPIVLASCFAIGSNWRTEILQHRAHLADFKLQAAVLLAAVILFAVGPLVAFVPKLAKVKRQGILEYGTLAQLHSREFDDKWIRHRAGYEQEFLAAPEVSTLIDLASSYQNIQKMQTLPFDKSSVMVLAVSFAVPMLPVILAEVPLATVVKDLLQALK